MEFSNWYDMVTWYRWKPQYMLNYFNNKQHRAFMINNGDVIFNADRTISYRTFPNRQSTPWYFYDTTRQPQGCYWNDCMREEDSEKVILTKEDGYVYAGLPLYLIYKSGILQDHIALSKVCDIILFIRQQIIISGIIHVISGQHGPGN